MGLDPQRTVVAENGSVIELSRKTIKVTDTVPAGRVFVDGSGVGDVAAWCCATASTWPRTA